jgi:dolichol-phosphate mannosyltransferase
VDKTCSIIIPTYNEAENILSLLEEIKQTLSSRYDYEIVIADDDSTDGTWRLVESAAKNDQTLKLLRRKGKRGLGPSIVDGFRRAKGDILLVMDGDGQHDAKCLPKLIDSAMENDMVVGTRFADGGLIEGKWPFYRLAASRLAARAAFFMLRVNVSDPMSGFFAVRKNAFDDIANLLNPEGFKIMLEILFLLRKKCPDRKISERGIRFKKRRAGHSKLGIGVILSYFKMLWRLKMLRLKP